MTAPLSGEESNPEPAGSEDPVLAPAAQSPALTAVEAEVLLLRPEYWIG
jgi:hypothetical protein